MGLVFSKASHAEDNSKIIKSFVQEGYLLLRQHKLDKAMLAFQNAIDLDYGCLDAHIGKFNSTNDTDEKRSILNELTKLYPDNLRTLGRKYALELILGNDEASDLIADQIISSKPSNSVGDYSLKYLAYANRNDDKRDDYKNALKMLNKALKLDKKDTHLHFIKAQHIYEHNLKDALKHLNIALKFDPLFCDAWSLKGNILSDMGQHEEALAAYDKALGINPNDIDTLHNKGVECYRHQEYQQFLELDSKILNINPNDSDANDGVATAYHCLNNLEQALIYRNRSIEIDPDNEFYYFARGSLYLDLEMKKEALEDFAKGYERFKKHGEKAEEHGKLVTQCLSARDELIEEFNKLAQTKDIETIEVPEESGTDAVQTLNADIAVANTTKHKLINDAAEALNPHSKASDDVLAIMQQQMAAMMATITALQTKVTELESTAVKKEEVSWAVKINHSKETMAANIAKIEKDLVSYKYYEGFKFALNAAYTSSVVIVDGKVALDTPGSSLGAIAFAAGFIPLVGGGVKSAIMSIGEVIKDMPVKNAAVKFSKIASGPVECDNLVLHIAMRITLHPSKDAEIHRPEAPEKAQGFWSGLADKFSALTEKVTTMFEGDRYDSPHAKLGYRDAFTLVQKIGNGEISTDKDGLVDRCCEFLIGKQNVALAGNSGEEEIFGFGELA